MNIINLTPHQIVIRQTLHSKLYEYGVAAEDGEMKYIDADTMTADADKQLAEALAKLGVDQNADFWFACDWRKNNERDNGIDQRETHRHHE